MTTREIISPVFRFVSGMPLGLRRALPAAALMLAAGALFAVQAALVKIGLKNLPPLELVFFRGLVCALAVLVYAQWRGLSLASSRPLEQLGLGVVGFVSLAMYFASIGLLPLVTATALNYTAPLFIALLLCGRSLRRDAATMLWVVAGFGGVCLVLQPSFVSRSATGVALGLLSGLTGAVAYLLLGRLGRSGEPQRVTAFWFSIAVASLAGIPMLAQGVAAATAQQLALALAIGLLATMAQLAVIKAYSVCAPLVPSTFSYAAVIFSSLIGAWGFGDRLGFLDALGIALIVASGVLVSAVQAQGAPSSPPQDGDRVEHLRSLYAAFRLGRRPDQVQYVFMIGNSQDNIAERLRARGGISDPFRDPQLERLWQARFCPARYDVDELLKMPAATLGGAYARHMSSRGLRPDFYEDVAPRHRMHFLRLRVRQTHDIWHVLCGFDTDVVGEVGLQAFYFAQFPNGQSALILVAIILRCMLRGRFGDLELLVEAFCEGYRCGRRAQSLLAVEWERLWGESVDSLRRRYGVEVPRCRAGTLAPLPSA